MSAVTKVDLPTMEECNWVVDSIKGRNPHFFNMDGLSDADRLSVLITIWLLQRMPTTTKVYHKEAEKE